MWEKEVFAGAGKENRGCPFQEGATVKNPPEKVGGGSRSGGVAEKKISDWGGLRFPTPQNGKKNRSDKIGLFVFQKSPPFVPKKGAPKYLL